MPIGRESRPAADLPWRAFGRWATIPSWGAA